MGRSRKNKNRRRNRGGNKTAQGNTAIPTIFTPPVDPIVVTTNPVKVEWFDVEAVNPTAGVYTMTAGSYRNRLAQALGGGTPAYIVLKVAAYMEAGNGIVVLTDYATGVACSDEGSYCRRPAAGLSYSPAAETVIVTATTGAIHTIKAEPANSKLVLRVKLKYWKSA